MKGRTSLLLAACAATSVVATPCPPTKPVDSNMLQNDVKLENIVKHLESWEKSAYANGGNRVMGSQGHNETLSYIVSHLEHLGYYDIEKQPYNATVQTYSNATFLINGVSFDVDPMTNTKNGSFDGVPLVWTNSYGCNGTSDWPPEVAGAIAIVSRGPAGGNCPFAVKSAYAGLAGALGLVVYNNVNESFGGTLGTGEPEMGPTIPTISLSNTDGLALVERFKAGEELTANFFTATAFAQAYSYNIIATTKHGDPDNILFLGAHSDGVDAGPGINDNGSGSASLLEVAIRLAHFATNSTVRFGWWTGEEEGLLGSTYYVEQLPPAEALKVRLYLNFDMVASGNGVLFRYDGDGSRFNMSGPPGSDLAEKLFADYFASKDTPLSESEFNGRSDYGPFLDVNVPCGGLDTGAEKAKTPEEAIIWGGEAGLSYDVNYHGPGDTLKNMSLPFLEINSKAISHAVATYGKSFEGFPARIPPPAPEEKRKRALKTHSSGYGKSWRDYFPSQ